MKKIRMSVNVGRLWVTLVFVFLLCSSAFAAPLFISQFGSPKTDIGYKTASDLDGNIFVAGDTQGNLDGKTFTGTQDGFLRKMDSTGKLVWTVLFGNAAYTEIRGLALDSSGNAFVCGTTTGSFGGSNFGGYDFFVAKVSPTGSILWMDQSGTSLEDYAQAVTVDSSGNAYVVGWTMGSLDKVRNPKIYRDAFVTKYAAAGGRVWTRQFNTASRSLNNFGYNICQYNNMLYVTGSNPANGAGNLFLQAYDLDGNSKWVRNIGAENTTGKAIAADSTGVYVAGFSIAAFDGIPFLGGYRNSIIIKYDLSGNKLWSRLWGAGYWDEAYDMVIDSNSNVMVIGATKGKLDMQAPCGGMDIYLTKFSSTGTKIYTSLTGTASTDYGYGICLDPSDNIIITGTTYFMFSGQKSAGGYDAFITAYASETDAATATITVLDQSSSNAPLSSTSVSVLDATNTTQQLLSDSEGKVRIKMKKSGTVSCSKSKTGYKSVMEPETFVVNHGAKNNMSTYMTKVSNQPSWTIRKTVLSNGNNPGMIATLPVDCTAYWLINQLQKNGATYFVVLYYSPNASGYAGSIYNGGYSYQCGGYPYFDMNSKRNTILKAGSAYIFYTIQDLTITDWTGCMTTFDPRKK